MRKIDQLADYVEARESTIEGAQQGAFAIQDIPKGVRIGEYRGRLLSMEQYESLEDKRYTFEVAKRFRGRYYLFYVDAKDLAYSNVLRYVNGAYSQSQRAMINVESYQYAGKIWYRSIKVIKAGQELITDYGDNYWQ